MRSERGIDDDDDDDDDDDSNLGRHVIHEVYYLAYFKFAFAEVILINHVP
jgi:hypothetical protein